MTIDEVKELLRKKVEGIDREIAQLNADLNRHTAIRAELMSILEEISKEPTRKV